MHVAKYILYDVARKVDSFNIPRKVDAVLREKSLLQVVPCNITLTKDKYPEKSPCQGPAPALSGRMTPLSVLLLLSFNLKGARTPRDLESNISGEAD